MQRGSIEDELCLYYKEDVAGMSVECALKISGKYLHTLLPLVY